jgi:hypothetical protein
MAHSVAQTEFSCGSCGRGVNSLHPTLTSFFSGTLAHIIICGIFKTIQLDFAPAPSKYMVHLASKKSGNEM